MESDRLRRSSLACGRARRAPGQHRGMAAGAVVPHRFRAPGAIVLDPVPARGHLEVVAVHPGGTDPRHRPVAALDRKSTRLNSSHGYISYAVFCLKKKILDVLSSA